MQGGQILSGLKRPAGGEFVADSGTGKRNDDDSAAARVAALLISAAVLARRALGWLAVRAIDREVSPGSLAGISVLMAVCAAGWFSGGAGEDGARGLLAMCGWLAFLLAGRGLAAFRVRRAQRADGAETAGDTVGADAETAPDGGTDWLVLPTVTWADKAPAGPGARDTGSAGTRAASAGLARAASPTAGVAESWLAEGEMTGGGLLGAGLAASDVTGQETDGRLGFGWLAAVCAMAAECAIYGGMAAGDGHRGLIESWPLAVFTISSIAIADLLGECRAAVLTPERRRALGRNPALRAIGLLLRVPPALRGLLALVAYAFGGPQPALVAVLSLEGVAIVAAIATFTTVVRAPWSPARAKDARPDTAAAAASGRATPTTARITAIVGVTGSPGETTAVQYTTTPSAAWIAAGRRQPTRPEAAPVEAATKTAATKATTKAAATKATTKAAATKATTKAAGTKATTKATANPRASSAAHSAADSAGTPVAHGRDLILELRDDGAAARWAGRIVQGNLIPLPPALAGLIATAMLAALGLRHLPGFIALTPPVVMMLAAPGSSHPHDSRSDWVVPVLLAGAQYIYLGSLGFALALPGPIVFSACALVAIWYASTIAGLTGRPGTTAATRASGSQTDETADDPAAAAPTWGAGLGWETRMFLVGLAATFGLATFGYVGLAAYLGVLLCRKVMTGYLVLREEDRQ